MSEPSASREAGVVTRVLLVVIQFYRAAISPLRPPCCRYTPTCSEYAVDALRLHGLGRGSWLAARRVLRCHPWHHGGLDPVPTPTAASASARRRMTVA